MDEPYWIIDSAKIFNPNFNHPLHNSLSNLVNLEELTLGNNFNLPLNDSLSNLSNLRKLTFGIF